MHFEQLFAISVVCLLIPIEAQIFRKANVMDSILTATTTSTSTTEQPSKLCDVISGYWQNELGSKLFLNSLEDNGSDLTGWIRTSVETVQGASGIKKTGNIVGLRHPNGIFSFVTLWAESVTAWTGQCYISSKGAAYLRTTWLLRSPTNATDAWMSTKIGQDIFKRP